MTRFIALIIALAAAAAAMSMLVQGRADSVRGPGGSQPTPSAAPLDDVDDASRAKLERILREAEGESPTRAPRVQGDH